ncbi:hypothetical protein EZJ19_09550 [Parasulfuritortus cantonensis]|uniref:Uncharacterized protein n=1 Tax=Parasulfuritortus cantonensis TaxID=2528202 RepID=A0A4R1BCA9_9PROT|nr:hypothetical protein [Parasulfuritortus cantonensis]TCJ14681.1 hypothetical protein EZJ19_09550 [Parasulfuritortus cantonensis]
MPPSIIAARLIDPKMSTSLRNVLTQQRHNVIVFAILVIASLLYYYFKRNHLGFHTRDFQYYLSGYILKTSSNNTGTININPEGFNAYGFSGTDGYPNIFSDIHFSPITYPISALYQLGGEPLVATLFAGAAAAAILLALSLFVRHTDHAKTLTSFATIILLPGF